MTISASSIVRRATNIIMDETSIRWPAHEVVRWLNDAQRAIVSVRPDAINVTGTANLATGPRQDLDLMTLAQLPLKLIRAWRNTAAASNKNAVMLTAQHLLDSQQPNWYQMAPSINIQHYMFDPRDPKTFYCYPPAAAGAQLEINYAAYPTDIVEPTVGANYSDVLGNLTVPDIYDGPVLDMVLYRCYLKDSEFAGNQERAAKHRDAAIAALGMEIKATLAVQPQLKPGLSSAPGA